MMRTSTVVARPVASTTELRLPDAFPDVCMAEPEGFTTADGTTRRPLSRLSAVYCSGTLAHSPLAGSSRESSRRSPVLTLP